MFIQDELTTTQGQPLLIQAEFTTTQGQLLLIQAEFTTTQGQPAFHISSERMFSLASGFVFPPGSILRQNQQQNIITKLHFIVLL